MADMEEINGLEHNYVESFINIERNTTPFGY